MSAGGGTVDTGLSSDILGGGGGGGSRRLPAEPPSEAAIGTGDILYDTDDRVRVGVLQGTPPQLTLQVGTYPLMVLSVKAAEHIARGLAVALRHRAARDRTGEVSDD